MSAEQPPTDPDAAGGPPPVAPPREAWQQPAGGQALPRGGSALIPTDNQASLIAYYSGVCACLPVLGIPLAILGLWQGIVAIERIKANPGMHGKFHAWVGIVLGGVSVTYHLAVAVFLFLIPKH